MRDNAMRELLPLLGHSELVPKRSARTLRATQRSIIKQVLFHTAPFRVGTARRYHQELPGIGSGTPLTLAADPCLADKV